MTAQNIYRSVGNPFVFAASPAAWATGQSYNWGTVVVKDLQTYFCLLNHTSGIFATDLDAGKWLAVGNAVWTPQNQGSGTGRVSAVWDRGDGDLPVRYRWRASCAWAAGTPSVSDSFRLYLLGSLTAAGPTALTTGGAGGGLAGFGDAQITSEAGLLANAYMFGAVNATAEGGSKLYVADGVVNLLDRYVGIAGFNGGGLAIANVARNVWCLLQPMPETIEAAA